jgi:NAD(P)-dependent dehydrogenase (short-subunit alcohol dehydrogenase family)
MSRVALVTGPNKGLGKEVVRQLGRTGMTMLLGSRDGGHGAEAADPFFEKVGEVQF